MCCWLLSAGSVEKISCTSSPVSILDRLPVQPYRERHSVLH
jgi:hypothetical protein